MFTVMPRLRRFSPKRQIPESASSEALRTSFPYTFEPTKHIALRYPLCLLDFELAVLHNACRNRGVGVANPTCDESMARAVRAHQRCGCE